MNWTIRNIPNEVHQYVKGRAKLEDTSINKIYVRSLKEWVAAQRTVVKRI